MVAEIMSAVLVSVLTGIVLSGLGMMARWVAGRVALPAR